jgi:two-component system KDP operon response regulator KdpE
VHSFFSWGPLLYFNPLCLQVRRKETRALNTKILVIEDDAQLVELLRQKLELEGYQVLSARDGVEGLRLLHEQQPHLILLDLMIPRMNGWETCGRIREYSDIPIIMLTALESVENKVRGLELGADDYVTKPVSLKELVARIRAALRRYGHPSTENLMVKVDDYLLVDRARRRIATNGQWKELSPIEYRILNCFLDNTGRILTHQSLLTQVWGWEYVEETDYLKVYIHHLRKKIEQDPQKPRYILTERGLGYRFQKP